MGMEDQCVQDKIFQLMSLGATSLPESFPLFPYIQKTLLMMTRPCVKSCASVTGCNPLEVGEAGSLIALCVEILLSRDSSLSLLQIASDVLLLTFQASPKEDMSRGIISLTGAILNRRLKISTTRLVLSLFHTIIRNGMHKNLFTNTSTQGLADEFSFEMINLCILAKLAMTDGHLDTGIVIYNEDLEASGVHMHTLVFFASFLMIYLVPGSELSRTPFYVSLTKGFPAWIPKHFLDGFECVSVLELLRATLCFFKQRLSEFKTFLTEQPRFVGEFVTLATSITCSSREAYQVLRQIVVDIIIVLIETVEEAEDLTSLICVTLFHCLNSLIVLPLFSKSVIFANLDCPIIPKAIGHLVLSDAYSCLDEDITMELRRQKESLVKEMSSGSSRAERGSKIAVERAYFCLWSLLRVITGEKYRLYPVYLIKLTYLPSTSLLLYYLLNVLTNLASANSQDISGLALNCMTNLYMHCLGVLVQASSMTCASATEFRPQLPNSILSIQSNIVERLDFLGKVRRIGSSILSCGKTIRDTKPDAILSVLSECLADNSTSPTSRAPTELIAILPLLAGVVHPSVPFLLLFSKKGSAVLDSTISQDDYFYHVLSGETIHPDMDELDLFRLCFRNFLLSGEGQEIERAMISISNAVARVIGELPSDHKIRLIGHAPSLRILLGSIVVLTTECLSEKIALSSKMTMSRFVSILMGSSQIKEYLSGNYQLSEQTKGQPIPLHEDLVSKFSSMYQRIRNAPLAVDRTIYDVLSLPTGIALPSSTCIKLAEKASTRTKDALGPNESGQPRFVNVFKDWCTSSSMLPGTMDQLISMTVHQTCLHMRTMEQLKSIFGHQRSRLLDDAETDSISLMEYYFHIYLLVQAALTHFVSGALAGTIGSGGLALSVDYSSGLYVACHAVHAYSLKMLAPLSKSSTSSSAVMSSLIERELISSSYLSRYFADQCEYLRLSEYMSASSPNAWIKLSSKLHSGGANHTYAALYGISIRSFIQYSNHATEKWRAKNLNDVVMHMVRILISLHALNVISTSLPDLAVELDIYPSIKDVILSTGPLASLQSICDVFAYSGDAIASKVLMCPFELCKEVVAAFETKADYSVIIHDGMIKLVTRTADLKGLDTEDSSLLKHTAQISATYMALMLLGSLKFYANIISHLAPHVLVVCLPEVTGLVDLALKTAQTHSTTISTSLQPVHSKLKPGQGNFKLETSVVILSLCIYLLLLKKLAGGIRTSSSCVSDLSLVYKRLEEAAYLEDTSIKYVSKSMIALMGAIYAELNSLDNSVATLRNITLSYPQLCLTILRRYTSTDIFLSLLLDCIYELLCLNNCQDNILRSIFLPQLRSFCSTNLLTLASQLHQLFRGEPISSDILKSRRSVTIMLPIGSKVVTLPPLASFFFGDVASPKSSEKSDDDAVKSVLSRIATALLPKKVRDSSPAVTQVSINKETIERLAKFLATISSAEISQSIVLRFLSELGTESFETLKTSTAVSCDILCLYFSISMYNFLRTTHVTFDSFYLSLPLYWLEDSDTAASNTVTQFAIPLLLPIFLATRALEDTSNPLLWMHIANTLAFFARELACSDDSRAFFFQQVLLPIILLARNTVPLTQFEQNLSRTPELVNKIVSISKEIVKDIANTELKAVLDRQLSVLGL
ncbi:Hypothetical protein DHA2_151606 [Giardia duodenalis]|uniref:SEC7 domain-containing protein n=1 Tax=Giardia intestinalis TaxID=5741 RepID=V6TQV6_GIAIN|nr:Hypothetical protein DHA2_151606 [Giardia intestinalis]